MSKIVLNVSYKVPDLPVAIREEKGLAVRRVEAPTRAANDDDLIAWFLDAEFITAHVDDLKALAPAPGSLLLWNPHGDSLRTDPILADLVFDQVLSFKDPEWFLRTLRNLLRQLSFERQLAQKDAFLRLREKENSEQIEALFDGFVKASVQAIESRDPTTSGHSKRVAVYTVSLAKAVDRVTYGAYGGTHFTVEHLKEIRYASLLHDFGKIGVREHVLVKAKKLYPQQIDLVKLRLGYIQKALLYGLMKERFEALVRNGNKGSEALRNDIDRRESEYLAEIDRYLRIITSANEASVLTEEPARVLDEIRRKTFEEPDGKVVEFLTEDEFNKLSIPRGSLDELERKEIESHVTHTFLFLRTIPWTKEMSNIPAIAYGHHEKLDGSGYPRGTLAPEIPVQTRMMTVSDIYDALTANRLPAEKALDILNIEVKEKKLDSDLVKIFIEAKIWEEKTE